MGAVEVAQFMRYGRLSAGYREHESEKNNTQDIGQEAYLYKQLYCIVGGMRGECGDMIAVCRRETASLSWQTVGSGQKGVVTDRHDPVSMAVRCTENGTTEGADRWLFRAFRFNRVRQCSGEPGTSPLPKLRLSGSAAEGYRLGQNFGSETP